MSVTSHEIQPAAAAHASFGPPWYFRELYKYLATFAGLTVIYVGFRLYQGVFGVSTGLDSSEPAFATHWMRLLYIELAVLAVVFPALWGYLWFTRDQNMDAMSPKEEITRYFTLTMWISVYTFAVYWAGSYFAEQDNSWHQVSDSRHAIHRQSYHRILFQLPALCASRRFRLDLREDPIAALRQGHFGSVDARCRRPVHDLGQRRLQ